MRDGRIDLRGKANGTDEGQAHVGLRGAAANVSYDEFFCAAASGKFISSIGG